ncbi:uncharacterized protein Pyn_07554 [Prunus yedoensis var. nudiflora]|uniref:Prolyl 4-hydroxylase alpha subunit domain-containing protein n=1 Tax=Prunus yedoensis var. nudiflora TaxID=2094558 RepID=A0A314UAD6_PRUYE|nr:uncharacterized protein Pyn_07554 [Prunus yedoensis var. nudiflora]
MGDRREADSSKTASKWPTIKTKPNLQITCLKDTHLFTVQNFLTSAESKAFVKAAESIGYKVGQRFGRHIDESNDLGDGKRTHYTLLIYLSGGFKPKATNDKSSPKDSSSEPLVGGETVFYGSRNTVVAEVPPTEGMALLHIHGDKCLLHEARNVTKGIKYVFRSDVVFA